MLSWLESLPISELIATSDLGYPLLLSIHSMGMAIVVGLLLILDFRVLGYARMIPFGVLERLMTLAWFGFALNLLSGTLLFMSTATRLSENWAFLLKMLCVIVGGFVSWALWRNLTAQGASQGMAAFDSGDLAASSSAKTLAIISIGIWVGAIIFGRLIAYVMDAAILKGTI